MSYRIAGIDVHKKMLAVVVSDVEIDGEYQFERRKFSSNPEQLRLLAAWLLEQEAEEVTGTSFFRDPTYLKPSTTADPRTRGSVRRASGFVQNLITTLNFRFPVRQAHVSTTAFGIRDSR